MTGELLALIDSDPAVLHGQACFRGARVAVSVVLDCPAAAMTDGEVREQYPSLPPEATRAALTYGAVMDREWFRATAPLVHRCDSSGVPALQLWDGDTYHHRGAGDSQSMLRQNGDVTKGEQLLEEFRRQRRGGDPRITTEGREILTRVIMGDLADDFADSLAAVSDADPVLSGRPDPERDFD